MKRLSSVLLAAFLTSAAMAVAIPKVANATVYLQCSLNPAGTATNSYSPTNNYWECGTNQPASTYGVYFTVTGLPAGSYTYAWSNTVYDGRYPSVTGCTTSTCSQLYGSTGDHDELVQVVITDLSTFAQQTVYAYAFSPAVCGGGSYFC